MSTKIEWTDETWNPIHGCTPISPGCKNCYAKRMAHRLAGRHGYPEAPNEFDVTLRPDRLEQPLKWRKARRVFVCSMSDLFHEDVPDHFIESIWQKMFLASHHTFQILTKRPQRVFDIVSKFENLLGDKVVLPNVHLGVTAENQAAADERIPLLLETPAAVRFLSAEPLLGAIDIRQYLYSSAVTTHRERGAAHIAYRKLDLVITGAETGPGKREMKLDWARSLRDQCQATGVSYFFKKDSDGNRLLDGRLWEEMPE